MMKRQYIVFCMLFLVSGGFAIFDINTFLINEITNASFYVVNPARQVDCGCNCGSNATYENGTTSQAWINIVREGCKHSLEVNNTNFPIVTNYNLNVTCVCSDGIWSNYPSIRIEENTDSNLGSNFTQVSSDFLILSEGIDANTTRIYNEVDALEENQALIFDNQSTIYNYLADPINTSLGHIFTQQTNDTILINESSLDASLDLLLEEVGMLMLATDHFPGEEVTIFLQLIVNNNGNPVNNASCYTTVYYPNKTVFLNNSLMCYLADSVGIYWKDITAPETEGTYMVAATCYRPQDAWEDSFLDYSLLEAYENVSIDDDKIILRDSAIYAWYHLNEASGVDVSDSSGNSRNGTTKNMEDADWVSAKLNNGLQFDGVNEYVDLGDIAGFERTNTFSIEGWAKLSAEGIIIGKQQWVSPFRGWYVGTNPSGWLQFVLTNTWGTNQLSAYQDAVDMTDNAWHHFVITYNGLSSVVGVKFYVDGQLRTTKGSPSTLSATIINSINTQMSGANGANELPTGILDELIIYDRVLDSNDVSYRWNSGSGTESATGLFNITDGYIRSNAIALNYTAWNNFSAEFNSQQGDISWQIQNSTNDTLCSALGDISTCAYSNATIKLYANISRNLTTHTSPDIDKWWVSWSVPTYVENIRGNSEIHISEDIGDKIDWHDTNMLSNFTAIDSNLGTNFSLINDEIDEVEENQASIATGIDANRTVLEGFLNRLSVGIDSNRTQIEAGQQRLATGMDANRSALNTTMTDNIIPKINTIYTYLVDTIYDYLVNTVYDYLVNTLKVSIENVFNISINGTASIGTVTNVTRILEIVDVPVKVWVVSASEYLFNTEGAISALVLDSNGDLLTTDVTCNATIFYPNDSEFTSEVPMPQIGASGIFKYNFTAPSTEGIYHYRSNCTLGTESDYDAGTFHVAEWATSIYWGERGAWN